ncbi:sensory box-containing diguanylate cyclase, putative, partial [Acidithiobacillus sp. GGI-221]
ITLEILEGDDFLEQQKALDHLLEIKALGVRLALDDVGSAYSSLLRIKDLPIDEIKLDQSFIRSLEQRPQDLHFVGTIQDLAAGMGVDLVVEGVETEDILDAIIVTGAQFRKRSANPPLRVGANQANADFFQFHGKSSWSFLLGQVGSFSSTSQRYAKGSMPLSLHVSMML